MVLFVCCLLVWRVLEETYTKWKVVCSFIHSGVCGLVFW